jgi:hypothetical protein
MKHSHDPHRASNPSTPIDSTPRSGVTDNLAVSPDQVSEVHDRPRVWGGLSKNAWIAVGVVIAILLLLILI